MSSEEFRFAFCFDRASRGWIAETSGPVAWALFPFDDYPVPPRQFENAIRKRCNEFAVRLKSANSDESLSIALTIRVASDYVQLAREFGIQHFVEQFTKLLSQAVSGQEALRSR